MLEQVKQIIRDRLVEALQGAKAAGALSLAELPPIVLEKPREKAHGDIAVTVAMTLAKAEKKPPRAVAEAILQHFNREGTYVAKAEIAGPGFINFTLDTAWLGEALRQVLQQGDRYGRSGAGAGQRVLVEFVSANPTGPMVVVQARSGAVGDTLCNLLEAAGYHVQREFYVNDAGNQVLVLGKTLEIRIRQQLGEAVELPEDAYPGDYVVELAQRYLAEHGPDALERLRHLPDLERADALGRWAAEQIRAGQEKVLLDYGVRFDCWFSERSLRDAGAPQQVIATLSERGHTYESDGAVWFRSTTFGDDKDRVLQKSDGAYTYLVPDIAYHLNKFERGFTHVIDILGPDHHGYIARMRAALQALGKPPEAFEVIISQQVRLLKGGELVTMSKRAGQFITLEDLLEDVGKDAARFFFLLRAPESPLDFDLDLARTQTADNPVFYVQYAHARISSILRQHEAGTVSDPLQADFTLLSDPSEQELIAHLAALAGEIAGAAQHREPHRLTRYALELATRFHAFYTRCRVLTEDEALTAARLALVRATGIVLRNSLTLLGVSAPERM